MTSLPEFKLKPVNDNPTNSARLLGHDVIVQTLKEFIESNEMISSSSVAIHGDWGTGKTSIMTTLHSKLDNEKIEVLFFEAWKYEYTNPSLGLIAEITEKYLKKDVALAQNIIKAAIYILTDKFLGLDLNQTERVIRGNRERMISLTDELKKIIAHINKRLVIIIDDLDRCDVENALQILSLMKLFLSVDNCVIIAAVDFKRLQQAWKKKYQILDSDDNDSRDYLDKIFQIRIAIPVPTRQRIREYLLSLTENMPHELQELFPMFSPSNPRAIKRMLNLISYRSYLLNSPHKIYSSCLWTLLEQKLGNETLVRLCDAIDRQSSLADFIVSRNIQEMKDVVNKYGVRKLLETIDFGILEVFLQRANTLVMGYGVVPNDLKNDFAILYVNTREHL